MTHNELDFTVSSDNGNTAIIKYFLNKTIKAKYATKYYIRTFH